MTKPSHSLFASCARGLEALLVEELRALGASEVEEGRAGARFSGTLEIAYRACLWSRVASRVLLPLASFPAPDETALYEGVRTIQFTDHLTVTQTLAVDFTTVASALTHTQYGALKTKDAIVDQFRDATGERPSVDRARPDVRFHVHVQSDVATLSLDLSGESLHRRGYRAQGTPAPLKETLAAAILLLAGWPEHARNGVPLLDPMCGSGTLPIEAGLIAADRAPGLLRSYWGFVGWRGHDAAVWQQLLDEAHARAEAAPRKLPTLRGFDLDGAAVRAANENLERAGLRGRVHVERRALEALEPVESASENPRGILVVNPPYGERIGDEKELEGLYQQLGDLLRRRFPGWTGWVFTGNPELGKKIGLRPARRHVLFNGPIECRLLEIPIASTPVKDAEGPGWRKPKRTSGAEGFANRLTKNFKHLRKWAKREDVSCWRVYDADLVEYAVAVDLYESSVHVQEYEPPATVDPQMAEARLDDILQVVPEVLGVDPKDVFLKVRRRQRGRDQYERQGFSGAVRTVREGGHRFEVNLSDYLDTGLFLDHRRVRSLVAELAPGRRFLNLFAYTCTASVYAAKAGAKSTLSVDLSHTYLEWAARNFKLNGLPERDHRLERADLLTWLPKAAEESTRYGLIFLAPPTFSNSKSMTDTLDIQRDHVELVRATAALLEPDGVLLFSNHFRRFKLDETTLPHLQIENVTHKTLPEDFKRSPRIHNSWKIILRK